MLPNGHTFNFDDLLALYKKWPGPGRPYEHISEILEKAKPFYRAAHDNETNGQRDFGQAWRNWKGTNFEKLIRFIVDEEIQSLNSAAGLDLASTTDDALKKGSLIYELDKVKRNLLIDYGKYGSHLPDADLVIYKRHSSHVLCIVSCKTSMRERIGQTAYWKLKLDKSAVTRHVRVALVTPDEGKRSLLHSSSIRASHAQELCDSKHVDIDATYVLNERTAANRISIKSFQRLFTRS